jgi:hypothetical protein
MLAARADHGEAVIVVFVTESGSVVVPRHVVGNPLHADTLHASPHAMKLEL